MLRLVCTSDVHGQQDQVTIPDGDVFIFAGDAAGQGGRSELRRFCEWVQRLPHRYKIIVAGNHDVDVEHLGKEHTEALMTAEGRHPEVIYLQDTRYEIQGLVFYGSPWTPRFFNWSFMATRGTKMMEKWALIPNNVDVLITHGPPFGRLDVSEYGPKRSGCEALAEKVGRLRPRLHIFGHIHGSYGWSEQHHSDGKITCYTNVSCCNAQYRPVNPPVVLDWDGNNFLPVVLEDDDEKRWRRPVTKYDCYRC